MQFGRIYGFVTSRPDGGRWLVVVLDDGRQLRTVRDEAITGGLATSDPGWLADQLVQETIGVDLALDGWEVIGEGSLDSEAVENDDLRAVARSPVWVVRRT